jgi:organic hydroperoxide reductase OsmC/OhrA
MTKTHGYHATIRWTGNQGSGTARYDGYSRDHVIELDGKPPLAGSSDPAFRGDPARTNPEEMLLASISTCHMLWFLYTASTLGLVVESYEDDAEAVMTMSADGSGQFTSATLRPRVTLSAGDPALADGAHYKAHEMCFIARSLNFDVGCEATTTSS